MKSINVKKVAAVATGVAMVGGALAGAFATVPTLSKSFFWDSTGNPNAVLVVGEKAMASDGIAAGNIAAVIGAGAHVAGADVTVEGADIGADGSVTVATGGGTAVSGSGVNYDVPTDGNNVTKNLNPSNTFLHRETLTINSTDYQYSEKAISSDLIVKYYEDGTDDYAGVFITASDNTFNYTLVFDSAVGQDQSQVEGKDIYFLGASYLINQWTTTKIELVKGSKTTLGVGQSVEVPVGNDTWTVTLTSAGIKESDNSGHAGVTVTDPDGGTHDYNLDTVNTQDVTVDGEFLVFLEAALKEYTPGVGGTAILRLGGDVITVEDSDEFESDSRYTAYIGLDSTSTYVKELTLALTDDVVADDNALELTGPMDYYKLQYLGDDVASDNIDTSTIEISGDTSNSILKTISYTDDDGIDHTLTIQDDDPSGYFKPVTHWNESDVLNGTDNLEDWIVLDNGKLLRLKPDYTCGNSTATNCGLKVKADTDSDWTEYLCSDVDYVNNTNVSNSHEMSSGGDGLMDYCLIEDVSTPASDIDVLIVVNGTEDDPLFAGEAGTRVAGNMKENLALGYINGSAEWYVNPHLNVSGLFQVDYDASSSGFDANGTTKPVNMLAGTLTFNSSFWDYNLTTDGAHNNGSVRIVEETTNGVLGSGVTGAILVEYVGGPQGDQANQGVRASYDASAALMSPDTNTYAVDTSGTEVETDDKNSVSLLGTSIVADGSDITIVTPKLQIDNVLFFGQPTGTVVTPGTSVYTVPGFVADSTVTAFTCVAKDYKYAGGYTFGTVGNLVVSDSTTPSGNSVVVGGYAVNDLALAKADAGLNAAGDYHVQFNTGGDMLYVAGYTADDTTKAANELIAAIKAL
jgi:hypothetical protein